MTTTPPTPPSGTPGPAGPGGPGGAGGSTVGDRLWAWLRRLGIQRRRGWVAGVCGGIAERFGVDPLLVRAGFAILLVVGGFGFPLYLVGWLLLPDKDGDIAAEEAVKRGHKGAIVLLVVTVLSVLSSLSGRWWVWLVLVPAALVGGWVLHARRSGKSGEEIGREASELATRIGDDVSRWAGSLGSRRGADPASGGTPATPYGDPTSPTATPAYGAPVGAPQTVTPYGAPYGAPYGMGPGRTGVPAAAVAPTRVVQRRRRRGGLLALLLAIGLAAVGWAVGLQVAQLPAAAGTPTPELVAAACALGGVGLALVVIGLVGRRAGFTGFLATVATVGVVVMTLSPVPTFWRDGMGDRMLVAGSMTSPSARWGVGDTTLDLTGATDGQTYNVQQAAGQVTVLVPSGTSANVRTALKAGDLKIGDQQVEHDGAGLTDDRTFGSGSTSVSVVVDLGVGDVVVKEKP
ncbi:PspC domain-containing protein [Lapillicoccus jejuensis]|uniref:Phage shock protein C (PspC) family protein n=1 Tax=Lapillicoccus jejuensis TaxID=402171 RepID=A0A542E1Z3_9MICO|nr:PspC domain-containing protein [Lapillicoccus jejuensis]TQJ09357.1 phage shock protein C (PspC) family protein [Lapillicoccus jejuensis]